MEKTAEQIAAEKETKTAEEIAAEKAAEDAKVEEDVVTIGDEVTPTSDDEAAPWIKDLRKRQKTLKAENRDLKEQLKKSSTDESVALGEKPTLENCDYDTDKFGKQLEQWHGKKAEITNRRAQVDAEQKQQDIEWQKKMDNYREKQSALNVPDYEDAEESVHETFSETQQGLIIQAADNSAIVIYALGKNSKRAKELAVITDPVKFVAALAKLEAQMKVTKRAVTTKPEEIIQSSGPVVTGDAVLEKLREEAAKSSDYTKVAEYRKQHEGK